MAHTLKIGEALISFTEEFARIDCNTIEQAGFTSEKNLSYSDWSDSIEALDLTNVMYNSKNGGSDYTIIKGKERYPLLTESPGAAPITIEHVEEVERCLTAYKEKCSHGCDPVLRNGEWLAFWLRWAIEHCERPVFVNF
jgi:hypothetical protein